MKTIILFDSFNEINFFIVDGDYTELDEVCIDVDPDVDTKEHKLAELLFKSDGAYKHEALNLKELVQRIKKEQEYKVIEVSEV